jgi:hypothetical protein
MDCRWCEFQTRERRSPPLFAKLGACRPFLPACHVRCTLAPSVRGVAPDAAHELPVSPPPIPFLPRDSEGTKCTSCGN